MIWNLVIPSLANRQIFPFGDHLGISRRNTVDHVETNGWPFLGLFAQLAVLIPCFLHGVLSPLATTSKLYSLTQCLDGSIPLETVVLFICGHVLGNIAHGIIPTLLPTKPLPESIDLDVRAHHGCSLMLGMVKTSPKNSRRMSLL